MRNRIIMHIDVNNAFLSWTAVDMLKKGSSKDIRKRYAIIGGDESMRRGIVLAKSNPCKEKGVKTADTIYSARRLCPYLEVYPPNFKLYQEYSNFLFNYLSKYTNVIERYSIDECFFDFTTISNVYKNPIKFAYKIKNDIYKLYGFTVNVGVGNNKLCAKMASDFTKPNKVHTLFLDEIESKMWPLDVSELFMIGKKTNLKLKKLNINTIYDLAHTSKDLLEKEFKKMGTMMYEYANGIDDSEVYYVNENPKSISNSTILPYNYSDKLQILKELEKLTKELCLKLNKLNMYTNTIGIWLKFDNLTKTSKQKSLDNNTNRFSDICIYVKELLDELYNEEKVRAVCVFFGNLDDVKKEQLSIFNINYKKDNIEELLNKINKKYEKNLITLASKIDKKNQNIKEKRNTYE